LAELLEGTGETGFDGALGDPERLGDFIDRHVVDYAHEEDFAVTVREFREGRAEGLSVGIPHCFRDSNGRLIGLGPIGFEAEAFVASAAVEGDVACSGVEVGG